MGLLRNLLAVLACSIMAIPVHAAPANPQQGTDYRVLPKAQPTDSGNKVEVTEFFWYSCPHCNEFDEPLNAWARKNADQIVFKRVPVAFRDSFVPQQKLYYTLEGMGKLDQLHGKVFQAIHVERNRLDTDAKVAEWAVKQGLDKQKFMDLYSSFGVQAKVSRATQMQNAYGVDGVPLIAIGGQYLTSPSIVGAGLRNQPESALHAATFQVMDWLVTQAAKNSNSTLAPAGGVGNKKP
jgi:thiol:disulfide interchange protein DsbA